jgi:hypothetical protein
LPIEAVRTFTRAQALIAQAIAGQRKHEKCYAARISSQVTTAQVTRRQYTQHKDTMTSKMGRLIDDDPLVVHHHNSCRRNNYVSHTTDHDYESRFELFLLDDGQKKVEQKDETRTSMLLPRHRSLCDLALVLTRLG